MVVNNEQNSIIGNACSAVILSFSGAACFATSIAMEYTAPYIINEITNTNSLFINLFISFVYNMCYH